MGNVLWKQEPIRSEALLGNFNISYSSGSQYRSTGRKEPIHKPAPPVAAAAVPCHPSERAPGYPEVQPECQRGGVHERVLERHAGAEGALGASASHSQNPESMERMVTKKQTHSPNPTKTIITNSPQGCIRGMETLCQICHQA